MSSRATFVGDPAVPWQILLSARVDRVPVAAELDLALRRVQEETGWPGRPAPTTTLPSYGALLAALAAHPDAAFPAATGICGTELVLRAHHAEVDGLGLLALLSRLLHVPVTSSARGVSTDRPRVGLGRTVARRLREVAVRPPARVRPTRHGAAPSGDVFARIIVPARPRTADLVVAAARVLPSVSTPADAGRLSVAVGVSREDGAHPTLRDSSGFLRLTDLAGCTRAEVRQLLATAPLQTGGQIGGAARLVARPLAWGTELLSDRLGSTVLVSHLGDVAAAGVTDLAFYPVAGGSAGISLGAVSHAGGTTVTLRGRAARHSTEGLQEILEALGEQVGSGQAC